MDTIKRLASSAHQRLHMGRGGTRKRLQIVAPFECGDELAAGMFRCRLEQLLGDPGKIGLQEPDLRQRILQMRIKSRGDQEEVGREGIERRQDTILVSRAEILAPVARRQGRIADIPDPRFVERARAGEERHLMAGAVEQILIGPKGGLGAVAVMHVEIDHRHALRAMGGAGMERRDGDRVEQAKAHGLGRFGVMPRGADGAEGIVRMSAGYLIHGAVVRAVDQVAGGHADNAFCAIRPPGHHAEPSKAMGFCLFNSVAVAALHARAAHGAKRVAVIDFDVHHGNGTQAAFWTDKDLFYGSSHQMPLFPGTGALDETGVGNICNAPLAPGDGSEDFRAAYEDRILPALDAFAPDFLLISAGFDAHLKDPLAQIRLLEPDFAWITEKLLDCLLYTSDAADDLTRVDLGG